MVATLLLALPLAVAAFASSPDPLEECRVLARAARLSAGAPAAAWAGIVLLGDGDYVPLRGGGGLPAWLPWFLGVLLLGLAGGSYLAFRARRLPLSLM